MKSGGKRKSFSGDSMKKAPKVNKDNPTGGVLKHSGGFTGRAHQTGPTKSVNRKGNP